MRFLMPDRFKAGPLSREDADALNRMARDLYHKVGAFAGVAPIIVSESEAGVSIALDPTAFAPAVGVGGAGCLFVQTADFDLSNSGAKVSIVGTGLGSMTIPAGTLIAGNTFRLQAGGELNVNGVNSTVEWWMYLGSQNATTVALTINSAFSSGWQFTGIITVQSVAGGNATINLHGMVLVGSTSAVGTSYDLVMWAEGVTVAVASANLVDLQFQFGTGNLNNTLETMVLTLEQLR